MLAKVGVGSLRAVELVGREIGARGRCVACWVGNFGSLAVAACVHAVPVVEEEGGGCGQDDVALVGQVSFGALGKGKEGHWEDDADRGKIYP